MLLFADKVTGDVLLSALHRFWTFLIPKGQFHHMPDLYANRVEDLFCEKLLTELLKNRRISHSLVSSMASWRHSGFSGNSTRAPAASKDPVFFHMLRCMARPAVALSKMFLDPKKEKVIHRAIFNAMLGTDRIEILRHNAKKDRAPPEGHPAA